MDIVHQLLERWDLLAFFIAINLLLGGLAQVFRWISVRTLNKWDDGIALKLSSVSEFVAKTLDWLHGNAPHKDSQTPPPSK